MKFVLIVWPLLISGSAMAQKPSVTALNRRSVPSFINSESGMRFYVANADEGKTCLRRKSTREIECRTMDGWRKIAAKIDAKMATRKD